MGEREVKQAERILKAVANKRRLAVIKFLSRTEQSSVGSIAEEIKLSFKSTSRHLSILFNADILERKQTSTTVLYRLVRPLSPILKTLISIL
jgi:DNA-binding transcriptional ArsR family regulator